MGVAASSGRTNRVINPDDNNNQFQNELDLSNAYYAIRNNFKQKKTPYI